MHDVRIVNIPGADSHPPGETFALNDWRTTGSVYTRIRIEGGGVEAAGFATKSTRGVAVVDSTFSGSAESSGAVFWQTDGITLTDLRVIGNRSGLNFERVTGDVLLTRPVFRGNANYDLQFGSDRGGASVTIADPVLKPEQKIVMNVPLRYHGGENGQKRSNVHVLVKGVDRTDELVRFK